VNNYTSKLDWTLDPQTWAGFRSLWIEWLENVFHENGVNPTFLSHEEYLLPKNQPNYRTLIIQKWGNELPELHVTKWKITLHCKK